MHKKDVAISIPLLITITVLFPLTALIFCLTWSIIYNFDQVTSTHCELPEFAPSISAATAASPQKYVSIVQLGPSQRRSQTNNLIDSMIADSAKHYWQEKQISSV